MRKILPLVFLFTCGWAMLAFAQNNAVSGTVSSAENTPKPLPGITVKVKNKPIGAITDSQGAFRVECSPSTDTLVFSALGFDNQEIPLNGRTTLQIALTEAGVQVDEVVITAIGISREKKALGYAVANVDVEEMQSAREANLVNTLSGKVAGLQVSKTSGGPGSSTRLVLRGASSLRDDNQPLIVVDGIPIDNTTRGSGGMWGGVDFGSPISDINPDDIESMTVLKGPNAAALYGSRAANGAIVITTKKGTAQKGIGVSFNSTFTVEMPVILRKFQNVYGAGSNGQFDINPEGTPYFNTALLAKSWGPKMEGQEYVDWDGETRTYSPQPNNFRDFFRNGLTATNSVALQGGSDKAGFRLSYTNLENRDIQPTSSFNRNTVNFTGNAKLHPKLTASFKSQLHQTKWSQSAQWVRWTGSS